MEAEHLGRILRELEEVNAGLSPERCSRVQAERFLRYYSSLKRLAAFGEAVFSARLGDAAELARVSGSSVGTARRTIETGRRMAEEPRLAEAARRGELSLDQAEVIAATTRVAPGSADDLLTVARTESFQVLRDKARSIRLAAEDRATLGERQHASRRLRHWVGEMGMVHIDAALEPHVGVPIVDRLEAEARRIARAADAAEPFERHLADALPRIATGGGASRGRAEMVVLVSHEVARRGWTGVEEGEHCKIPGIGPVDPVVAKEIARDAFLTALFYDGEDLRHFKRWTRNIPAPIRVALRLGDPPDFDGPRCVDCGRRSGIQWDHVRPFSRGGPTAVGNLAGRCLVCHLKKTAADRRTATLHRPTGPYRPGPLPARQPQPRGP